MSWHTVTRSAPCDICSKPDWCGRTYDGAVRCMRVKDAPPGWHVVNVDSQGGTVFRRNNEPPFQSPQPSGPKPTPKPNKGAKAWPDLSAAIEAAARSTGGEHVQTWTYQRGDGVDVFHVARFNLPDGSKQFRPVRQNGAGFVLGDPPGMLPLYRLPELSGASRVYVCEGEKAAEAAWSIGLVATTSAHGSKSAARSNWEPLRGKDVVILPDHDEPGEHYATAVATILDRLACQVRIVRLPDLPKHGDIHDWIEARDSIEADAIRSAIESFVKDASIWRPPADGAQSTHNDSRALRLSVKGPPPDPWKPFPTSVIPDPARTFIEKSAAAMQCDESFVALPMLIASAAVIGTSRRVELHPGWHEPCILWGAVVGESGMLKTPAIRAATKPLREIQAKALAEYKDQQAQYEEEVAQYDRDYAAWKRSKVGGVAPIKPRPPAQARILVSDVTVEGLAPILRDNPRGVLLVSDELAGWIGRFDRYSTSPGGDVAQWLPMHSGESIFVDRKTSGTIYVPIAHVCVVGGIQPETLRKVLGEHHFHNGLAARLMLAMPPRRSRRWSKAGLPVGCEAAYSLLIERLRELLPESIGGELVPVDMRMDHEAEVVWAEYYAAHNDEQLELSGSLASAWSKLEGGAVRLAMVIHLLRWAAGESVREDAIDAISMRAGVTLAKWFKNEARRVYAVLRENNDDRQVRHVLGLITRQGGTVTVRQWQRIRSHRTADDAIAELKQLEAAGLGRIQPAPQTGRGAPSTVFVLNSITTDTDTNTAGGPAEAIVSVSGVSGSHDGHTSRGNESQSHGHSE